MIDIHHHLLYGLDDGPESIRESVAMAKMAAEDGITHVVCTPHASHRYTFQPEENAARLARLREEIAQAGYDLKLGLGCDFHLTWDNIQDAKANPSKYSINGTKYLLVELPDQFIPMGLSNTFDELQQAGMVPIVTHPERNQALQRDPDKMREWVSNGALVQVTAGSVTGLFGSKAKALAHQFLSDRWVHFIATDAHGTGRRPPRMREAYELIGKHYGEETARRLCVTNPGAAFEGEPLGVQPYPKRLEDEWDEPPQRSWLRRFFSRA